ncbi:MAG: diadenylate cyclase CdaA [Eubacteriales bacterium]|jgi:diadenylate cyclase|nr:diadenylate cyclase CdaA [Eubacteriales bacterium]MDD4134252.1 diadenylate cyclase CdaA [Eubacteriales bacterium]
MNIAGRVETFFWNILNRPVLKDWIDIAILAFVLYKVFMLTRQTRASQVLKGFGVLLVVSWISDLLGLKALNWLFMSVLNNGAIVLMILFQPELRRALEQLGRGAKIDHIVDSQDEGGRIVYELSQAVQTLSQRRVGALVVFEQKTGLRDFIETGTTIDSRISGPLLVNLFEPNTPLHDGAVIIRGNRIMAAGCVLSLSENSSLGRDLGTRHRAGLGVTESTDAVVLIVSEETGIISLAQAGRLTRHLDGESLLEVLNEIYKSDRVNLFESVQSLARRFKRKGEREDERVS